MLQDGNERKRTDTETAKLAAIIQSSKDSIVSTDFDGILQTMNPAAEVQYGAHLRRDWARFVITLPTNMPVPH